METYCMPEEHQPTPGFNIKIPISDAYIDATCDSVKCYEYKKSLFEIAVSNIDCNIKDKSYKEQCNIAKYQMLHGMFLKRSNDITTHNKKVVDVYVDDKCDGNKNCMQYKQNLLKNAIDSIDCNNKNKLDQQKCEVIKLQLLDCKYQKFL